MSRRLLVTFAVVFIIIPVLARAGGGGSYDDGCGGCGGNCGRPSYDYEAPKPVVDKSAPPDECRNYLDGERKAGYERAKAELSCAISADDLTQLKAELDRCKTRFMDPVPIIAPPPSLPRSKGTVLIRMVKVKRGWSLGYIVEKYRAQFKTDLDATVRCNGFASANQTIYPRQTIKVCRWK